MAQIKVAGERFPSLITIKGNLDRNYTQLYFDNDNSLSDKVISPISHSLLSSNQGSHKITKPQDMTILSHDFRPDRLPTIMETGVLPFYKVPDRSKVSISLSSKDDISSLIMDKSLNLDLSIFNGNCIIPRNLPKTSLTDKCIVLDLDETLIHTMKNYQALGQLGLLTDPKHYKLRNRVYSLELYDVFTPDGNGIKSKVWGVTRPNLRKFLIFCFTYFRVVAVWSAGQTKYVHDIVDTIFKDISTPHITFTYPDCKVRDKRLIKPLSKMYQKSCGYMNERNTFVLDDRHDTFTMNPLNGIQIPAYRPNVTLTPNILTTSKISNNDQELIKLEKWLSLPEVIESTDIRKLNKAEIFI